MGVYQSRQPHPPQHEHYDPSDHHPNYGNHVGVTIPACPSVPIENFRRAVMLRPRQTLHVGIDHSDQLVEIAQQPRELEFLTALQVNPQLRTLPSSNFVYL